MSNITKVTNRHVWQEQKLHKPGHPKADHRGFAPALLCLNCRLPWFYDTQGSPPVTGCASGVNLKHAGTARQKDHLEQEMRIRADNDRREQREREQMPEMEYLRVPKALFEAMKEER